MEYTLNNYRARKIDEKYFVTTDHGSYCILSEEEFKKLKDNDIDENLKLKLEEKEIILTDKTEDEIVRLIRNRNHFLFSGVSLHIIVVTLKCDMNCIYCHASSKCEDTTKYNMDKKTAKETVDFIFQSPSPAITIEFQGGEPLLNWEVIKYIIEYAQEKNKTEKKDLRFQLVTNMTQMDEEKMNYLIDNNIGVCTSLDGPKELHDFNRKYVKGSNYDDVTRWIQRFTKEYEKRGIKDKRINALVTLTSESLSRYKEIIDDYVRLGLKQIHLRFLNHLGVAKNAWNKISYSPKEYLDFWKRSVSYIEELKKNGKEIRERMVEIMEKKIGSEFDPNYLELRSPCGAATGQLVYNYDGKIYTCDEGRMIGEDLFMLGTVKEEYKNIVTCDKACAVINASINDQYMCDNCAYKPYCGVCPVCNFTEQGSVIAKIPETDRCKIYTEQFDW